MAVDELGVEINPSGPFDGIEGYAHLAKNGLVLDASEYSEVEKWPHIEHTAFTCIEGNVQPVFVCRSYVDYGWIHRTHLLQWLNRESLLPVHHKPPISHRLIPMKLCPCLHESDLPRRKVPSDQFSFSNVHDPFVLAIIRMKMRRRMLPGSKVHPCSDTVEHPNRWHSSEPSIPDGSWSHKSKGGCLSFANREPPCSPIEWP